MAFQYFAKLRISEHIKNCITLHENELFADAIMRIYLIGYMASGKTRMGQEMSALTGYPFIDTDELFELKYRISILDFFERYNEESFRKIESEILVETLNYQDAIISTGGGTPCFFNNMEFIKRNGISIYLKVELKTLVDRLTVVRKKRPILKNIPENGLEPFIRKQLAERELFYIKADFTIDAAISTANDIVRVIST
jgi:shikimate kinase